MCSSDLNGKVLVAGGNGPAWLTACELYDPVAGTWAATGSLTTARVETTAALLTNGLVLIAGGRDSAGNSLASAELYNPANGTWAATGNLSAIRAGHRTAALSDGRILIVGGYGNFASQTHLATADLYDPATGTWSATGSLNAARQYATATKLPNGQVLTTGGNSGTQLTSTELFTAATGVWTNAGSLLTGRYFHTATLLNDGRTLLVGGQLTAGTALSTAELFTDPTNPPAVFVQPGGQSLVAGASATLSVTAGGSGTLTYQWRSNGVNIAGATAATLTLTLTNVQTAFSASYDVLVTNSLGSITSSVDRKSTL